MDSRLILAASLLYAGLGTAQATPTKSNGATEQLVGEWRGRSLCVTTTRPACTDETVSYRIRRPKAGVEAFALEASKLVDGKFEVMGAELECSFEATRQQLLCPMGQGRWQFRWDGRQLVGALLDPSGLFRLIRVDKVAP
jgi:hypothetical protein